MNFADKLKSERERTGLTQQQAADLLEQSKSIVEKWESEARTPSAITQEGALARLSKLKTKAKP